MGLKVDIAQCVYTELCTVQENKMFTYSCVLGTV